MEDTSYNMCCTIPLEVLCGCNCLWLPFGHTLKYNVEKPKLYYSEHNLHVHNVAYHHQPNKSRGRGAYGMPRGYRSPGRLGTIGGGRLYLLRGGGGTTFPLLDPLLTPFL